MPQCYFCKTWTTLKTDTLCASCFGDTRKVDELVRKAAGVEALERRVALAEAILRDLDGHPRADYPVSLDKRIKAWLAAEPRKEQP